VFIEGEALDSGPDSYSPENQQNPPDYVIRVCNQGSCNDPTRIVSERDIVIGPLLRDLAFKPDILSLDGEGDDAEPITFNPYSEDNEVTVSGLPCRGLKITYYLDDDVTKYNSDESASVNNNRSDDDDEYFLSFTNDTDEDVGDIQDRFIPTVPDQYLLGSVTEHLLKWEGFNDDDEIKEGASTVYLGNLEAFVDVDDGTREGVSSWNVIKEGFYYLDIGMIREDDDEQKQRIQISVEVSYDLDL